MLAFWPHPTLHYCPIDGHCGECTYIHKLLSRNPDIIFFDILLLDVLAGGGDIAKPCLVQVGQHMIFHEAPVTQERSFQVTSLHFGNLFPIKFSNVRISWKTYTLKEMSQGFSESSKRRTDLWKDRELYSPESCSGLGSWRNNPRTEKQEWKDEGARNTEWGSETENHRLNWKWKEGKLFILLDDEWRKK